MNAELNPADRVLAYLKDREAWEQRASRSYREGKATGSVAASLDAIQVEYEALLARHCASAVLSAGLRAAFGDPPDVAKAVRVLGIEDEGATVAVNTEELEFWPLRPSRYRYVLVRESGTWKIADRQWWNVDGSTINFVL